MSAGRSAWSAIPATSISTDSLVLATGAQARWLDLPSEQKFRGYGVSACATCDGFFYRGKEVLVIGGGNTAVEEALFLTNFASKVTVVHRRDSFRAERILQERLYKNPKISVLWHTVLDDVVGDENPLKVRAAVLRNIKTGEVTKRPVDGIFIAIGHAPASELVAGQVEMKHWRLHQDRAALDRDLGAGPVCRRRRRRRCLPTSRYRRRARLHGGARSGKIPRRARRGRAAHGGGMIFAFHPPKDAIMDWDKLKVFHAAAEAGSFTHAGEQLGLSQSAVSRQVSALEQELAVSLFHRHARGLILTEQGDLLFRTAHDVFMKLEAARAKLTDSRERPNGDLRVTTTPGIGVHWLTPRLGEFVDLYPEIRVTLADHRGGARPRHARGRCRHPPAPADPARSHPAQIVLGALPHLRVAGIPQALRHAAHARGPRQSPHSGARRKHTRPICSARAGWSRWRATAKGRARRIS